MEGPRVAASPTSRPSIARWMPACGSMACGNSGRQPPALPPLRRLRLRHINPATARASTLGRVSNAADHFVQPLPPAARGRLFARVVTHRDAPLCMVEAELQDRGAHVTRLLASELLPGPSLDAPTFQLLGRLYDGLIVPHVGTLDAAQIAAAAGVPVVFDDLDPQAPSA